MASNNAKYKKAAPSKTMLASAVSAVLMGVYGMPSQADDDAYQSSIGISVNRGSYDIDDTTAFKGRDVDSTELGVDFMLGETWRGHINYQNIDAQNQSGNVSQIRPAAYSSPFGYKLFRFSNFAHPTQDFDELEFTAGYDIQLGESFVVEPWAGFKYMEMDVEAGAQDVTYISAGPGGAGLGGPFSSPLPVTQLIIDKAAGVGVTIKQPAGSGYAEQDIKGYGLTLGADSMLRLSEDWSLSTDVGIDYLNVDRDIDAAGNYAAMNGSSDDWILGLDAKVSLDYYLAHADEEQVGFVVSMGYRYQSWQDLFIDDLQNNEADYELQGGFLELGVEF